MRFLLMFFIGFFPLFADAQLVDLEISGPAFDVMDLAGLRRPVEYPVTFSVSDFETKPWMKEFEWVVVVNKATTGDDRQSLRIYRNQVLVDASTIEQDLYAESASLAWHLKDFPKRIWEHGVFKISTGREEFEAKGEHGSQRDNYTITPSGYFVPQYFVKKHKSEAYSNTTCGGKAQTVTEERLVGRWPNQRVVRTTRTIQPVKCVYMEDVIFFNGGIALHKAISGTEPVLGTKASGGCVRMPGAVSAYLYKHLKDAKSVDLPLVKQDGTAAVDAAGNIIRVSRNKSVWGELDARSVLIIVHSTVTQRPVPIPTPRPEF